jgi:hypothetical protein
MESKKQILKLGNATKLTMGRQHYYHESLGRVNWKVIK